MDGNSPDIEPIGAPPSTAEELIGAHISARASSLNTDIKQDEVGSFFTLLLV
jgi:hypothetical protein